MVNASVQQYPHSKDCADCVPLQLTPHLVIATQPNTAPKRYGCQRFIGGLERIAATLD